MQKKKFSLTQLIFMALMAAVMCIAGPLAVPIGPVPITLTNLVIYIAVGVLGTAQGTISYCLYLLLGMVGLPVFSGYAGGLGKLAGPTGGYLIGFIAMALIGGIVMEVSHRKLIPTLIGWFIGTAVDYLFGTLWFMYIMHTPSMASCVESVNTQPMVVLAFKLEIIWSPIFTVTPSIVTPGSSDATATLMREVESVPYGSQFDRVLNHAYRDGMTVRPISTTMATTLVLIRLRSCIKTRKIFFIV